MKRGQGPIGIIIGLIIVGLLFGVVAWAFRPSTTGQVILNSEETQENFVSEPFELRAWVVNVKGIQLDLMNRAEGEVFVKSVEVIGCSTTEYSQMMNPRESMLFFLPCNLDGGETFSGAIVVHYSSTDGTDAKAIGNVKDVV
jgi:hypothetical protein